MSDCGDGNGVLQTKPFRRFSLFFFFTFTAAVVTRIGFFVPKGKMLRALRCYVCQIKPYPCNVGLNKMEIHRFLRALPLKCQSTAGLT